MLFRSISYVYFVCDGPHSYTKSWEADRRAQSRAADRARLEDKRRDLDAMASTVITRDTQVVTTRFVPDTHDMEDVDLGESLVAKKTREQDAIQSLLADNIQRHEAHLSIYLSQRDVADIAARLHRRLPDLVADIHASGEGEMACAALVTNRVASAVISNDSDVVPLGAPYTLCIVPRRGVEMLVLDRVHAALEVTQDQLRAACVLAGTDFTPYIKGAGINTCITAVKRHHSVQGVLRAWRKKLHATKGHAWPQPRVIQGHIADHCPRCGAAPASVQHRMQRQCPH